MKHCSSIIHLGIYRMPSPRHRHVSRRDLTAIIIIINYYSYCFSAYMDWKPTTRRRGGPIHGVYLCASIGGGILVIYDCRLGVSGLIAAIPVYSRLLLYLWSKTQI